MSKSVRRSGGQKMKGPSAMADDDISTEPDRSSSRQPTKSRATKQGPTDVRSRTNSTARSKKTSDKPLRNATRASRKTGSNGNGVKRTDRRKECRSRQNMKRLARRRVGTEMSPRTSRVIANLIALRPKRNAMTRNKETTTGMSWREEKDLKRALYASLNLSRNASGASESCCQEPRRSLPNKAPAKPGPVSELIGCYGDGGTSTNGSTTTSNNGDSQRESVPFRSQVRAQRKFAQGCSAGGSATSTPRKTVAAPTCMMSGKHADTEDFLTFLCLRGSQALPKHLEHFAYAPITKHAAGYRANLSVGRAGVRRVTPESSHDDDDDDLGVKPLNKDASHDSTVTKPSTMQCGKSTVTSGGVMSRLTREGRAAARRQLVRAACKTLSRGHSASKGRVLTRSQRAPLPDRWTDSLPVRKRPGSRRHSKPMARRMAARLAIAGVATPAPTTRLRDRSSTTPAQQPNKALPVRSGRRAKRSTANFSYDEDHPLFFIEDDRSPSPPAKKPRNSRQPTEGSPPTLRKRKQVTDLSTATPPSSGQDAECGDWKIQGLHTCSSTSPPPVSQSHPLVSPAYHPGNEQFDDPIDYLDSIQHDAESHGMCRIVPPDSWQPECSISAETRFSTQTQYIHKVHKRWGPNVIQLECVKKHLESQQRPVIQHPLVGGVELDIVGLHNAVHKYGGLQQVIDKGRWSKVADFMGITKSQAQERASRLYDTYCKYLLSYDLLSDEEKSQVKREVQREANRDRSALDHDCVIKSKTRILSELFRISRNTTAMWFPGEQPSAEQVEAKYWGIVNERSQHVSVLSASADTGMCASGFPSHRHSPYSGHGWNFNVLQNNSGSLLKHIGEVADVTVPTLHVGMLFSTTCWSRDLHHLPYIVYLHSGADIVWYCIPRSDESKLRKAIKEICPHLVDLSDSLWLRPDTLMVEPKLLQQHGVRVYRTVQKQGQYLVVWPGAFVAGIGCGYNIFESIRYGTVHWIPLGVKASKMLRESSEADLFSLDQLLWSIAKLESSPLGSLRVILPHLEKVLNEELSLRKRLQEVGVRSAEVDVFSEVAVTTTTRRKQHSTETDVADNRCRTCKRICYLSMVMNEEDDVIFCLQHSFAHVERRKKNLRSSHLHCRFSKKEIRELLAKTKARLGTPIVSRKHSPKIKLSPL